MSEAHEAGHVPVLFDEVLQYLAIEPGQCVVDCTAGLGGHSTAIADRLGPTGRLVAIDQDSSSLEVAKRRVQGCAVEWIHDSFANLENVIRALRVEKVDAVLADLGVSSPQLDVPERGFSFRLEGPLDMRMNPERGPTAADLVAQLSERELAWIFKEYGEERHSGLVAKRIAEARRKQPIRTTSELANLVRAIIGRGRSGHRRGGGSIDPATRVFQALRIAVNDELGALETFLKSASEVVREGGRAVVISFHSLEDRRVKQAFRNRDVWRALTKSPVTASDEEMRRNPRSRSAKLRAAVRQGKMANPSP